MLDTAKVGDFVYKPFDPLKPGKIISVIPYVTRGGIKSNKCEVKFLDGKVEWIEAIQLNDFDYHTEEHLKKYNKFEALRVKLRNI